MPFPATAALLQDRLGAAGAAAFDLEAGCTGFIYALVMGAQTIAAGVYENVLVVGAEVLSAITDWTDRGTCVLMGDGAGAVVLRPTAEDGGIRSFQLRSDGSKGASLSMPAGGSRLPASAETVANRQHYIQMNGRDIFRFAVPILEEATRAVVAEAGLTLDDVKVIIPHQANIRIIEAAGQRLGMAPERFVCNMDRFGNTSSASVPMALHEAVKDGRVQAGDYVVLVGFGAGLTWGAALLRW
jgi:3-oxoacyl-[acyl-carrier-protein] synthase-3